MVSFYENRRLQERCLERDSRNILDLAVEDVVFGPLGKQKSKNLITNQQFSRRSDREGFFIAKKRGSFGAVNDRGR